MTQIDITTYVPFLHENFDFIRTTIELGRTVAAKGAEGELASAFINLNVVDYIAGHLLQNLKIVTYLTTYHELNVVFKKDTDFDEIPLGPKIKELNKYDFPDKVDFISDLDHFNKLRRKVTHNLLRKYSIAEGSKIDADLQELIKTAERLLSRYDSISEGIKNMWKSYCDRLNLRRGYSAPTQSTGVSIYPPQNEATQVV